MEGRKERSYRKGPASSYTLQIHPFGDTVLPSVPHFLQSHYSLTVHPGLYLSMSKPLLGQSPQHLIGSGNAQTPKRPALQISEVSLKPVKIYHQHTCVCSGLGSPPGIWIIPHHQKHQVVPPRPPASHSSLLICLEPEGACTFTPSDTCGR